MAGIFICGNSNNGLEMIQCIGVDDATTCDEGIECIRSSCGRPLFPHIGVSYAGSSDPYDDESSTSTQSIITIASLLYSLVPYLLLTYFAFHFLVMGDVVSISRLGLMGFASLMNDVLLKNLVDQPRPTGSCLYFHSYGMPSGHAATSIGLLTYMLLELLLHHPNLFGKNHMSTGESYGVGNEEGELSPDANLSFAWGFGWQKRSGGSESNGVEAMVLASSSRERLASLLPPSHESAEAISVPVVATNLDPTSCDTILNQHQECHLQSKWLHHYYALLWTAILLPVPLTRIYLHDHTPMQVIVGSFVGIILGNIWYFCIIRGVLSRLGGVKNAKYHVGLRN